MVRLLTLITILSVVWTFLTLGGALTPQEAGFIVVAAFIPLVLFPKQTDKVIRYVAAAAAVYVLMVRLGSAQALVMLGTTCGLFLGFYIMFRPLLPKQRK